ncbi:SCO2322 family protein [Streptomyces halobius]|uniref:MYXO-CTERM domain-containing protein n=1 Tax=Streptomyces halobius TaxID=2879846 RepID=A0ABY4MK80_9ACTN|nr:SCO2322 family protein [Streptomyces halobius]UQA98010.1 hypothetical protein K9S39_31405 [Streptomyces halobius]
MVVVGTVTGPAAAPARAEAQAPNQAQAQAQAPDRAQAQKYRYWSFWTGKSGDSGGGKGAGSWAYAAEGPGTLRPADGTVEGFRFAVSADSASDGRPRATADFDAICHDTPATDGTKRLGVVIDFGTAADAPGGETPPKARTACAQVPEDASAGEALAQVARPLRYGSNALLCGIAGYPKAGCADEVSGTGGASSSSDASPRSGKPTAEARGDGGSDDRADGADGGPSAGVFGGIAAVVVLGAAAVWQARRRRG